MNWYNIGILSWYSANIVTLSVFNALSIGSGLVAAVLLCVKREDILEFILEGQQYSQSKNHRSSLSLSLIVNNVYNQRLIYFRGTITNIREAASLLSHRQQCPLQSGRACTPLLFQLIHKITCSFSVKMKYPMVAFPMPTVKVIQQQR